MNRKVKPLEVSPVIRSARYICLFSGIFYGVAKLKAYRAYENSAKAAREKMYKDMKERERQQKLIEETKAVKDLREELKDLWV